MTLDVAFRTLAAAGWEDHLVEISSPEQLPSLLQRLQHEQAFDAVVHHTGRKPLDSGFPDHEVAFGVRGPVGAMLYSDGEIGAWVTLGAGPDQPPVYADGEFPAHCEIPLSDLEQALAEFLEAAQRPTCVQWQAVS